MTDWTPDLTAYIDSCTAENFETMKAAVLSDMPGLTALGRGVFERMDWRKSPRLCRMIRERFTGGKRVESFLGVPAARLAPAPTVAADFLEEVL